MLCFRMKDREELSQVARRAATELFESSYGDVSRGLGVRRQAPVRLYRASLHEAAAGAKKN